MELPAGVAEADPAIPTAQVTTMVDEADVAAESEKPASKAEAAAAVAAESLASEEGAAKKDKPMLSRGGKIAVGFGGLLLAAIVCVIGIGTLSGEDTPVGEQPIATGQELSSVDIDSGLERIPENVDLFLEQARVLAARGDHEAAVNSLLTALEGGMGGDESWVHEEAGYIFMDIGDPESAVVEFQQALSLDPLATWNYSNLAAALIADGREDEVSSALLSAFGVPEITDDPLALSDLGWEFLSHDLLDEAEQAFFRSIEGGATFPDPWEGLANQRYATGDLPAAMAELQGGIDQFPEHAPFYELLGYWAWEEGEFDRAIEGFSQAIELDPTNSGLYGSLASLFVDLGREPEAIELIQSGIDRYPNAPQAFIVAADFYMGLGLTDEAIPLYDRAVELDPEDPWSYASLARAEASLGNLSLARQALERADARNPGDPWLDEWIGWTYIDLGDCQKAIEFFSRAQELDPSIESAEQGIRECRG